MALLRDFELAAVWRLGRQGDAENQLMTALSRSPSIGPFWVISVPQSDMQIIDFARGG